MSGIGDLLSNEVYMLFILDSRINPYLRLCLLQTTSPVDATSTPQDIFVTEGDGDTNIIISSQPVPAGPSLLASPLFPVAAVLAIVFVAFLLAIVTMLIIRKCLVVS